MQNPIEECRVVLVDDEADKLEGRRSWLRSAGFHDVTILDFHQALIYQYWNEVHTLVVDGFDDAKDTERESWISELAPGDRIFQLDRFMGVRVVRAAREANPNLVITVVSGYVDKSPELVQRFHKRGANYIYSNRATHSGDDFLEAIRNPGRGPGYVRPPVSGRKANLEKLLDVLGGGQSEWDTNVVEAVRQVLIDDKDREDVLDKDKGVTARKFNALMDYVKELSGLVVNSGAPDHRKIRLERVRSFLVSKVLGEKYRHRDDEDGGGW